MNAKSALLEQLRIDREPPRARDSRAGRGEARPDEWRLRRWLAIGAVPLGVLLVAAAWIHSRAEVRPVRAAVAQQIKHEIRTNAAPGTSRGSLLDATGYVIPLRQATVSAKGIYKVRDVLVQQGEKVQAQQVIARLDDTNTRAALEQAQAQVRQLGAALAAAKQAADDARPIFLRVKREVDEGLISPDAFDAAKAKYDTVVSAVSVAEENLNVAKATLEINKRAEEDTVIRAPFAGVVTVKSAQPGEIVSPQFMGGGGIVAIVDMDSLEVDVDVNENFISRVRPDQPAQITLDAYPDWHIPAQIIAIIPTADRSKATVQVRVGFKQKDARILPQMGARVSFLDAPTPAPDAQH